jgi:hypothetical protein
VCNALIKSVLNAFRDWGRFIETPGPRRIFAQDELLVQVGKCAAAQ